MNEISLLEVPFFAENLLEKDVGILLNILNNLIAFALNRF